MTRVSALFEQNRLLKRKALIPYFTAGDPFIDRQLQVALMQALVKGGADIIEVGIPFSDPMADGPVIQRASERALVRGMSLQKTLDLIKAFRDVDHKTPVVLMGYCNPIMRFGLQAFADQAQQAQVDGMIIVDLPPEEADPIEAVFVERQLPLIYLVAPTTDPQRYSEFQKRAKAYLYYVSLTGITGAQLSNPELINERIDLLRKQFSIPIVIGFGIKDPLQAKELAQSSDGIVIGSALVNLLAQAKDVPSEVIAFLQPFRKVLTH